MCGFAGILYSELFFEKEEIISKTIDHLLKRGPDQHYVYDLESSLLINTRLSIQDIEHGKLPYHEDNNSSYLAYNGELYNKLTLQRELESLGYSLSENSDTEIVYKILTHFAEFGLSKLDGMFSLAYYNEQDKTVLIARDRFGVKPLFYSFLNNSFSFSSTPYFIKKINSSKFNPDFIADFIQHNYISTEKSPYQGINQLPPGTFLKVSLDRPGDKMPSLYWDPYKPLNSLQSSDPSQLAKLIEKNISSQLIGERKVGVFLSSGIDSALIAKLAKAKVPALKAFHIHYCGEEEDELNLTKETANLLGIELTSIAFSPYDFISEIENFVLDSYLPLADPGALPLYFLAKSINGEATVLLSGDGADELFAGYPTLLATQLQQMLSRLPLRNFKTPSLLRKFLNPLQKYKIDLFTSSLQSKSQTIHGNWRHVFSNKEIKELTGLDMPLEDVAYRDVFNNILDKNFYIDKINTLLIADFSVWLPKNNFLKLDIATMSHSIEGRVPYINNEMYDYLFSLPGKKKWSYLKNKVLLRDFADTTLPKKITKRPKKPFHPPYESWFRNELYTFVYDLLTNSDLISKYGFNKEFITNMLLDHKNQISNNTFKIYNLIILEKWLSIHS